MKKTKFIVGDNVKVVAGNHKGTFGPITKFSKDRSRVFVEGLKATKHQKPSQQNTEGSITEIEKSVHISNIRLVDPKSKEQITKIAYITENNKKIRIAAKSKAVIK